MEHSTAAGNGKIGVAKADRVDTDNEAKTWDADNGGAETDMDRGDKDFVGIEGWTIA